MGEENISQEFRLKKIGETKNYFIKEWISKKHKKVYMVLNYIKHLLISASAVTACTSISTSAFWLVFLKDLRVL